jgi:hypothetical protein
MSSPLATFDVSPLLAERGIALASLGAAYLVLLATVVLTGVVFYVARSSLVISPNRGARDYGIYVSSMLAVMLIATVLENESLRAGTATLHYVLVPQLLLLLGLHVAIWRRQEPWLVALGGAAAAATLVVGAAVNLATEAVAPAYWVGLLLLGALLVFLWMKAVSTQRGFVKASSIYLSSKESQGAALSPQKPWLGLEHWVALIGASLGLGVANSLLRGHGLDEVPAVEVAAESGLVLLATALVCAVPAASYWLTRKAWMPELTRFVWLAWIVVGFSLTYGNYLRSLARA